MSASEVIEQIKTLPPAELKLVREFLLNGEDENVGVSSTKYVDRETARVLGAKIMEENEELFRKLAQ